MNAIKDTDVLGKEALIRSADSNDYDAARRPIVPVVRFHDPQFPENAYIADDGVARNLEREYQRDAALNIKRNNIPYRILLLPQSPQGVRCREMFEQFNQLLDTPLIPETRDLALMLRCIQHKWQVRLLWLANELCDRPVPDLADSHLRHLVTQCGFSQLELEVPHDLTLYHLLQAGEGEVREWCERHQIKYPFATPFELFLEILQEEFTASLEHCFNFMPFCTNQRKREDEHRLWTAFLNDRFFDGEEENAKYERSNQAIEEELVAVLQSSRWLGRIILALRECKGADHLNDPWKAYRQAYQPLIRLIADEITYLQEQPTITGTTSHRVPITGEITPEGYIVWFTA